MSRSHFTRFAKATSTGVPDVSPTTDPAALPARRTA